MQETLAEIGEKQLLQRISSYIGESPAVVRAFSEDCAVIDSGRETFDLFTTDVLIEEVHFKRDYIPPFSIGRKALKVNISDVSAMGGRPRFFMVSIGAPKTTASSTIDEIYQGMISIASPLNLVCIGGNVSASKVLFVDIFLIGDVLKDQVILRNGAREGDSILVTGSLGGAAEGYKLLNDGYRLLGGGTEGLILPDTDHESRYVQDCIQNQLDPPCWNSVAQEFASWKKVSSMIDLSDGLSSDLAEICRESVVGAVVEAARIPISPGVLYWERKRKLPPIALALEGGEDYHLLLTVPGAKKEEFLRMAEQRNFPLYDIGRIVPATKGLYMVDELGMKKPLGEGYDHFKI